jgi:hypothetical protein
MLFTDAAKPAPAATGNGLQIDQLGGSIKTARNTSQPKTQDAAAAPSRHTVSSNSGPLWRRYCHAVSGKPLDQAATLAIWNAWLATFIPNERDRAAIPAPRLLQGEKRKATYAASAAQA